LSPRPFKGRQKPASRAASRASPGLVLSEIGAAAHIQAAAVGLGPASSHIGGGGAATVGHAPSAEAPQGFSVASSTRVARQGDAFSRVARAMARPPVSRVMPIAGRGVGIPVGRFPTACERRYTSGRCPRELLPQRIDLGGTLDHGPARPRSHWMRAGHWHAALAGSKVAEAVGAATSRKVLSRPPSLRTDAAAVVDHQKRRRCRRCIWGFQPAEAVLTQGGRAC